MQLFFDDDSRELQILNEEFLTESGNKEKVYKIKGIFSTIGEKNRNGRVYPREIWEEQVRKYQPFISNGSTRSLMEYEHPDRTEVDLMKAVAKITSLYIQGNYVMGEAVLLDNPQANQLKSLIKNGIKISVSSRGVGDVVNGVVTDYELITYDIVPNPSDFNATMNGVCESSILNEGIVQDKYYMIDNYGNIIQIDENSNRVISNKNNVTQRFLRESKKNSDENIKIIQSEFKKRFNDFISKL
jgi:hypothetical protein